MSVFAKYYLLIPEQVDNSFWISVSEIFTESTKRLDLQSETVRAKSDRFSYMKKLKELSGKMKKGDTIFCLFFYNNYSETILEILSKGVRVVVFNTAVPEDIAQEISNSKYASNFFQFYPDDILAGKLGIKSLVEHYELIFGKRNKLKILAISGKPDSTPSIERDKGVDLYLLENNHVQLIQRVSGQWKEQTAYELAKFALRRYKDLDIIWTASDSMLLGVNKTLVENTGKRSIVIGGIDWSRDGINLVRSNDYSLSIGGHFLEIGKIIFLMVEYDKNKIDRKKIDSHKKFTGFLALSSKNWKEKESILNKTMRKKLTNEQFRKLLID